MPTTRATDDNEYKYMYWIFKGGIGKFWDWLSLLQITRQEKGGGGIGDGEA